MPTRLPQREAAGMHDLAAGLEQEVTRTSRSCRTVARDSVLRAELRETRWRRWLRRASLRLPTTKLLTALDRQAEADALAPEVVAHHHQSPPVRSQLRIILLGSTSVTDKIRSALRDA